MCEKPLKAGITQKMNAVIHKYFIVESIMQLAHSN